MRRSTLTKLREAASEIDFLHESFSFTALMEAAEDISERIMEANTASTFSFLLTAAVQEFANDVYKDHETIYPNFVTVINSQRRSEIYGGLYRGAMPKPLDAGEKFQDTAFKGFEAELVNHKVGHIETFERELFDDDQTGQVRSRAGSLGENFKIYEEIYVISRLFGAARTEEDVEVSASKYQSGNVFTTTIGNRPVSFSRLTQTSLEAAHTAMRRIRDPLGRKFVVVPKVLLVSPEDELEAIRIVNSPTMANTTSSSGALALRVNPLAGRYTVYSSPYVPAYAWMIGDFKKGFVFQRRDALEIVQENPNSGNSFIQEVYAFRARERFEADWIEPRFAFLGNDGSVTS